MSTVRPRPSAPRSALRERQEKTSFSLPVPRPARLGRATLYPTRFDALYLRSSDAYRFVFSDFVTIQ